MSEPHVDNEVLAQAAQAIDAKYMDHLMNAIVRFSMDGGKELGLSETQIANVLASSCALVAVNLNKPMGCEQARFNEAVKEGIPRLYDAMFSMRDWFDRRMPWRMQSTHMKNAQARIITDLNKSGERKFDA